VRVLVTKVLARAGFDCQGAAGAIEALALCQCGARFHLVITCHFLRDGDGLIFIEQLRAAGCNARIIVHASPFDQETHSAYTALGVETFLWKPTHLSEIVAAVTALCKN